MDCDHLDDDQSRATFCPRSLIGHERLARQAMTGKIGVMTGREDPVRDLAAFYPERGEKMREAQSHASRQIDRTTQKKSSSRLRTRAFRSARSLLIGRVCSA